MYYLSINNRFRLDGSRQFLIEKEAVQKHMKMCVICVIFITTKISTFVL